MDVPALPLTTSSNREALLRASRDWPSWTLSPRQLSDLELILNGGFAPLDRFMSREEADICRRERRLIDASPFPCPILLDLAERAATDAVASKHLVLRDPEGVPTAVLDVADAWQSTGHFVAGPVTGLQLSSHPDAAHVRFAPSDIAREIERRGWNAAVAFPTRGFVHRAEYEATSAALERADGGLVLMSLTDPGEDLRDRLLRVACVEAAAARYPPDRVLVWLVPLAPRSRPSDDLMLSAVVARNAGCNEMIVTESIEPEAEIELRRFASRLNVGFTHAPIDRSTEARMLAAGERLPESYTFPEVAEKILTRYPPKHRRGFTLFFTGLSGSGKSTIANLVRVKLMERTGRPVTLLDGDLVRQHLSSELGFSREHRDLNIRRIAFVASEITKHGGIAICAPIAPYESVREEARRAVEAVGGFVLVFVDTPLEVCEARDRKGLYAKARAGLIPEFTGVSDPYEAPRNAEIVIQTERESAARAAERVVSYLEQQGYLAAGGTQ